MRKQQAAPGELELVRDFVNTVDLEQGTERLADCEGLRQWLVERGLADPEIKVTRGQLARAIALREALREILLAHNGREHPAEDAAEGAAEGMAEGTGEGAAEDAAEGTAEVLDRVADRARLRLRFDAHGRGTLKPAAAGVEGALGELLAIVQRAGEDGTWVRLKACREHSCEWAFYDHTKNRSGTWCNMAVCGNRAKARAYRERRGEP